MDLLIYILLFVFGSIMGSFFHVVSTRLSNNESIVFPPSHCHNCNHRLKWYELIPIVSYIIQGGKSRCCKNKLPISYLIIEIVTGALYCVNYHSFGFGIEFFIGLVFISALIIVIVSDIEYMIILDEVLYIAGALIVAISFIGYGFTETIYHIGYGLLAFLTMYLIKIIGDFLFKKESLGGGDIKLMFLFGIVLGYPLSVSTIFLATFIAFPMALIIMFMHKDHLIPFGPFLSMSAILIFISKIDFMDIINYLTR